MPKRTPTEVAHDFDFFGRWLPVRLVERTRPVRQFTLVVWAGEYPVLIDRVWTLLSPVPQVFSSRIPPAATPRPHRGGRGNEGRRVFVSLGPIVGTAHPVGLADRLYRALEVAMVVPDAAPAACVRVVRLIPRIPLATHVSHQPRIVITGHFASAIT